MNDLSRRQVIQGAATSLLVAALPGEALAGDNMAAAIEATKEWAHQKTWQMVVRVVMTPTYEPSFSEGDRVEIHFKANKRDRRSFKAASLETAEGKVSCVIPPNAVPWRYARSRMRGAPQKFWAKTRKLSDWTRPGTGRLYVVGTRNGYSIVTAQRMRSLVAPKFKVGVPQTIG